MRSWLLLLLSLLILPCCHDESSSVAGKSSGSASPSGAMRFFNLAVMPPAGAKYEGRKSGMVEKEVFTLPKVEGDTEDGQLSFYGGSKMGDREINIERWYGQMEQPNGKSSAEVGKRSEFQAGPLKVTMIDVSGTYAEPAMMDPTPKAKKANYRMIAAYIEGAKGPWYVKSAGPEKTMAHWRDGIEQMLKTLIPE